jgi:hypothetical protein
MIYLVIIVYLLFLIYHFDYKGKIAGKKRWFYLTCIIFILLSGLRYRVGGDTVGYMEMYDDFPTLFTVDWKNFETIFQPLWVLFVLIHKTITPDFALLQFTHAIILNVSLFAFIKKRTDHLFIFIFFYFIMQYYFLLNFEVLRESLAAAIFLIGFKYWENKKWLYYYLFAFISFEIHVSAVFLFILPFFRNLNLNLKTVSILLIVLIFLSEIFFNLFSEIFFDLFLEKSQNFELTESLVENISGYTKGIEGTHYNWRFRLFSIGRNVILPFSILLLPKYFNIRYKMQFSSLIFLYLFVSCFSVLSFISQRFLNYIFVFYLFFLSDCIVLLMQKYKKSSFIIFFSIAFLFTFSNSYLLFKKAEDGFAAYRSYYPYYSIFTKQEDKERELRHWNRQ